MSPTICLNMIVKNESRIITRMLESVVGLIDCYCICDTGSTDNTMELIAKYFKDKDIKGKIVQEPFKNFGYNRSWALKQCHGMSDYVLLMDADMVLVCNKFDTNTLTDDMYWVHQGRGDFYYKNTRLIRNDPMFSYTGVTHEYVSHPDNKPLIQTQIDKSKLFILDLEDGGEKADKFPRDIRLLERGIVDEPANRPRYCFYLANSYYGQGDWNQAIKWYRERIQAGGWVQEIWYSYYRIGMCYKNMDLIENAICTWMDGYNVLPTRVENILEIITHYRFIGKQKLSYIYYQIAKSLLGKITQQDKDDHLFLENDAYSHKVDYEFTIIACYMGIKNINDAIITVLCNTHDHSIATNVLSNMKFYRDVLHTNCRIDMSCTLERVVAGKSRRFLSSSMSIIRHADGYLANQRFVNYWIDAHGNNLDCDDHVITMNRYMVMTKDFKITKDRLIGMGHEKPPNPRYIGIEDVRIYRNTDNQIICTGTALHSNGKLGISMGTYSEQRIDATELQQHFNESECEKNWVLCQIDGELRCVYRWYPLTICKINGNELQVLRQEPMPMFFKHIRGSSNGFEYMDEIWFVGHIVSYEQPRHYYHVIMVFDRSMKLSRYTAPFKFTNEPIEYCLGIMVEQVGDNLNDARVLMPYSTWDRTTHIGVYDKQYIEQKLKYKQSNV
jgi:glycosyltransferase involved in cell wall biosynthesis